MVEAFLIILCIAIIAYHYLYTRESNAQIRQLTKDIAELAKLTKARDLPEYVASTKPITHDSNPYEKEEYIPAEQADDDVFNKMIKFQLNGEEEDNGR